MELNEKWVSCYVKYQHAGEEDFPEWSYRTIKLRFAIFTQQPILWR